jgi:probable phosphoglycerate mutase
LSSVHATRIIAIRHGETDWNVDTRIQGQLDIGLNAKGRWQAGRVAHALREESVQAIYASDLIRAWDTAQAIAQATGGTLQAHPGLRERHFGASQGKTFVEIETDSPEQALRWRKRDPLYAPQGGESLLVLRDRIVQTVTELAARHTGGQIVLVAHGGVLDVLYRAATGQDVQAPRAWNLGNTAINRLLWTPDGLTLVGWADVRHLEDDAARDETST